MNTKILLAGLACLSVVAVAQQSDSGQKTSKTGDVMVRESPSKASLGRRESPSKPTAVRESPTKSSTAMRESPSKTPLKVADVDGDGKADRNIGSQSSGAGAGVAINNSHSNIKSPRDAASGQASGKVNVQDLSVTKRSASSAPADPKK
ncbi:MAG TPA: hypothetical protein VMI10_20070 [Terriglobales bacterium]|nr:hypothetical protein [Terriglobales bacterium]